MNNISPFAPANDFYEWTGDLTDYDNGHLLRSEPLTNAELIPIASQGWRMLYVSTSHDGRKIPVSGLVFLPAGGAPASNGRPVISYAHGTTGITAAAAPSLNPNAQVLGYPILGELSTFLSVGYAVVCTDYEGLGTAGPHPYCHGISLAHSQIHAVTAGRQVSSELSNVWVAMGQSEGGQATMFSAAYATTFAPQLDYRGAVATAPPTEWPTLMAQTSTLGRVLTPGVLHAVSYRNPSLQVEQVLNEDGRTLLDAWRTSFLLEPGTVMETFAPLEGKPLFALADGEKTDGDASRRLAATLDFGDLEPPRGRLDRPVLLAEGGRDEFCVPGTITRLAEDLRAAGTQVEHHTYPRYSHLDIPFVAFPETLPFVQRIAPIT
ncbi:MAG: lipase family protein [Actinomycetia bacterium]|nr:lipase family protein [Actinomycetes bacterium]MCH9759738.1 lipase family protein [Actinomycetes bacterium]